MVILLMRYIIHKKLRIYGEILTDDAAPKVNFFWIGKQIIAIVSNLCLAILASIN